MKPSKSDRNFTPTSIEDASPLSTFSGPREEFQMLHGQVCGITVIPTPPAGLPPLVAGFSRLPLSSTARVCKLTGPRVAGIHENDHVPRPTAGCHVWPPSTETSTPATVPPPASVAVPVIVIAAPACTLAPAAGDVMVDTGGKESVDAVAKVNPDWMLAGCTPISANRLTVACCMLLSGVGLENPKGLS